jgi:hypothetical protein
MIWEIIILIITILLYALMLLVADDNAVFVWIGSLSLTVAVLMLVSILETKNPQPTALDVYRGNTTLEITYRDSVAVDSVVVYKVR